MADNETPHGAEPQDTPEPQETDWKAEARKWEARAKENLASAKANETAAKRLAEIEEAQKSEAQRLQEERDRVKQELEAERSARLRAEVAAAKGVPANLLNGSTQEELEAAADALIQFRGETQPKGLHIPAEGKQPPATGGSTAQQFADAVEGLL